MADDIQNDQVSESSENSENQNVSKSENQKEEASEVTETPTSSDTSGIPSNSESSEKTEAKEENKEEKTNRASKPVSANLEKIIEQIEKLSVLELADLVHALEERFGVSASAPVAVAATGAPAGNGEPAEEKTTFNVILASSGANKIAAIKAVRELVPTLSLKDAKDLVEAAPKPVLEGVNKQTAEEAKLKLTAAGATVELQ